jgi:hypothetical protein
MPAGNIPAGNPDALRKAVELMQNALIQQYADKTMYRPHPR